MTYVAILTTLFASLFPSSEPANDYATKLERQVKGLEQQVTEAKHDYAKAQNIADEALNHYKYLAELNRKNIGQVAADDVELAKRNYTSYRLETDIKQMKVRIAELELGLVKLRLQEARKNL